MSPKQKIYIKLISITMPSVRNTLSHKIIYGKERYSAFAISELTHNIYISVLDEEFGEHDLHILNHQAKWYYENAPQDYMYKIIIPIIKELFDIVPLDLKCKLIWSKPNI